MLYAAVTHARSWLLFMETRAAAEGPPSVARRGSLLSLAGRGGAQQAAGRDGGAADERSTGDEPRAQGADLALAAMSVNGAATARSLLREAALISHPGSSHSEGMV